MRLRVVSKLLTSILVGIDLSRYDTYVVVGREQPLDRCAHQAGLRSIAVDEVGNDARVMRLEDHPFFVLTLFVPQKHH